jgi:cellulose synthase/poly-beta-1,6-N-acetylglucosamine synthase-like glycosyltransferase
VIEVLVISAIVVYAARTLLLSWGAWRERLHAQPCDESVLPFVSIVIPARNEEHRIGRCLDSLTALDYPADRFEIIVVNDRSTDRTQQVASSYQHTLPMLRIVPIEDVREGNLRGKAGALDVGIASARGELVLLTDADCAVHPQWVRALVAQYRIPEVAMVCAYTLIDGNSPFDRYQAVEWNTTHTMASAGVYFRQYLGCFGNNMSIRRSVYHAVGGYRAIPFSVTEDLALLQAVGRRGHTVRYLCSPESCVVTEPCRTLGEYVRQHQRWVHGARGLGWRAYVFVATTATYWLGIIAALLLQQWEWVAAIVCTRGLSDLLLNIPPLVRLQRTQLIPWILPTTLAFGVLELSLPFLALSRSIRWKDQVFVTVQKRQSPGVL